MKRKLLSPSDNCFEILSLSKQVKVTQVKEFSEYSNKIIFPKFTNSQLKKIRNELSKPNSIFQEVLIKNSFKFQYDPKLISEILIKYKIQKNTPLFVTHFILFSYISWSIYYNSTCDSSNFPILLLSLNFISQFQEQPNDTLICDLIISSFFHAYSLFLNKNKESENFLELLSPLNDFYLCNNNLPDATYNLLAQAGHAIINQNLEPQSLIELNFYNIIDSLVQFHVNFPKNILEKILERSYFSLRRLDACVLSFLEHSASLFDDEILLKFLPILPLAISENIEKCDVLSPIPKYEKEEPFIIGPLSLNNIEQLASYSTFDEEPTDQNIKFPPQVPFEKLVNKKQIVIINHITNILKQRKTLITKFIEDFGPFLIMSQKSDHCFDIFAAFFLICEILNSRVKNKISEEKFPNSIVFNQVIFNPSITVFSVDEKMEKYYLAISTLRKLSINFLFNFKDKNQIRKVFSSFVPMPYLFAETVNRLLLLNFDFSDNQLINVISNSLMEPLLSYRLNTDLTKEAINVARNSVLSYLSALFKNHSNLFYFFSNLHFDIHILMLLFEDPLRPRILNYLSFFLSNASNIKDEVTSEIKSSLMLLVTNTEYDLNTSKGIELMTTVLEVANIVLDKVPSSSHTFEQFSVLFCNKISQVPKTKDYLPLLKISLTFFKYITNAQMFKFNEILSLEKGITNICGDDPDDEIEQKLLELFTNHNVITKPSLAYLYIQSFYHSAKLDNCFLKLIDLCNSNLDNCIALHDGEIDLLILNYIDNWRIDKSCISLSILTNSIKLIQIISSHICSYEIVRKFISLLNPLEGRYFPYYNSQIINSLHMLSLRPSNFPRAYFLPLVEDGKITATVPLSNPYFCFCFWFCHICYYKAGKTLLQLSNNDFSLIFETFGDLIIVTTSINDNKIIHEIKTELQTDKWYLFSCIITEDNILNIYLNTEKVLSINIQHAPFKKQVNVSINLNQINNKRANKKLFSLFGPFAILNSLEQKNITKLYRLGVYNFQVPSSCNLIAGFKPIISYGSKFSIENLNSIQFHTNLTRVSISHTFVDVLLTYCKFESLIPLFAQIDMTYKDDTKIIWNLYALIKLFQEILVLNVESQKSFAASSGFLIISHLLRNASDKHFDFQTYLLFYHFFVSLQYPDIKTQLFVGILTDFEIWLKASASDHIKILHKLSKMANKFPQYFYDNFDVKFFVTILQSLYWYEPTETTIARCLNRVRNEKFRVKKARGYLLKIALKIAKKKFTDKDLFAIISSSTNCGDFLQIYDLLDFILSLMNNLEVKFEPLFFRLISIITIYDSNLTKKIIQIFAHFSNFDSVVTELMNEYYPYFSNKQVLLKIVKIMNPSLIRFCSYMAIRSKFSINSLFKLISIYQTNFKKNNSFVDENDIWTITLLFVAKSMHLRKELIKYLVISRVNNFHKLFSQADLIGQILLNKSNIDINEYNEILRLLISEMLDNINDNNSNQLKPIVIHFVLFRRIENMNDALKTLFDDSPFNSEPNQNQFNNEKNRPFDFSNAKLFEAYVNKYNLAQSRTFYSGFHISKEGQCLDSEIALKSLTKLKLSNEINNIFSTISSNERKLDCFKFEIFRIFDDLNDSYSPEKIFVNQFIINFQNVVFKYNHYISQFKIHKQRIQYYSQLWSHFWRLMTISKAPWHSSLPSELSEQLHYKRDNTFCYGFCPFKTRRNYSFDPHLHASFSRDSGNLHLAKEKMSKYLHSKSVSYDSLAKKPISLLNINEMTDSEIPHFRESSTDNLQQLPSTNKINFECSCDHITVKEAYKSTFKIFSDYIIIAHSNSNVIKMIEKTSIILVLKRTVLHHPTGIEIFTNVRHSYFIDFKDNKTQTNVINALKKALPPRVVQTTDFKQYFSEQSFTNDWKTRKISNFEYLLLLNIFSGRSFNSPSQYPLVPWVLSDFSSETLDLNNFKVYRDLTKPIGTINEHRLNELMENQNKLKSYSIDSYLFSSGPVCPLTLFLWLIRLEPFTGLHIKVQGGKFDHAGRIFYSINDSYRLATSHMNDYRELIPEFYYCPEFLINNDKFDLGKRNDMPVDDVELPNWAHNNPYEFVYTMRKAMESDYVSNNLNHWIDLIWGVKQKADNNRYKSEMYADVWQNKPNISGDLKSSIEETLRQVCQIPPQLFSENHPLRNTQMFPKVSALIHTFSIDFIDKQNENEHDFVLAVNVTLCSTAITNNIDDNDILIYNNSSSSPDMGKEPNLNLQSDSDLAFANSNKSKKLLKIRVSLLCSSGKMLTRVVQINIYQLLDLLRSKSQSELHSTNVNKNMKNKDRKPSNLCLENEFESSVTVDQTVKIIYSKEMKINDFDLIFMKKNQNQSLNHCFYSPSFLQFSNSPSITLRGIGINSINNKENSESNTNENISLYEMVKDETSGNFISDVGNIENNKDDELFLVGKDRSDIYIIKFDNSSTETNDSTSGSTIASYSPKCCTMHYDVICVASDGLWTAICGKDAVIRLYKRNAITKKTCDDDDDDDDKNLGESLESGKSPFHSILSFCNSIVCCDIWSPFDIMVCGTKDPSLMIYSLSRGTVTKDINIKDILMKCPSFKYDIDNIALKKILITPSWGFILACMDAIIKDKGKVLNLILLFNANGNLIKVKEIDFAISCWTSWSCEKDFDYVLLSDDNGKLYMFEAFYLDITKPFYRCHRNILSVKYIIDGMIAIAVACDGKVFFVPYSSQT